MLSERLRKLRMPPDTFERHTLIAELAGDPPTVLDVGGIRGELNLFLPGSRVTTINMEGEDADATFDGDRLPFETDSFDVAVSLDVLEHIPPAGRSTHFAELTRVSKRLVVVCCPLGTPAHVDAEHELAAWYQETTGSDHRFLREHLETGLPPAAELETLARSTGHPFRLRFHGDFRRANRAFMSSTRLRANPGPAAALSYARIRLDPRRRLKLEEDQSEFANRAFVEIFIAAGSGSGGV